MKSNTSTDVYCVFVYLDKKAAERFKARYQKIFKKIITIDIQDEVYQKSFFEFSGYQVGLDLIIDTDYGNIKKIVFVNDTFINGHIKFASTSVIENIVESLRGKNDNFLVGIRRQNLLVSSKYYISTWCFGICISNCASSKLDFLCGFKSQHELLQSSTLKRGHFYEKVMTWLNPSSIFRGWHNAPYFQKLERQKLDRKLISIYLENCIPIHNEFILGLPLSVTMSKHYFRDSKTKVGLSLDRCYLNYKKILKRSLKLLT